VSGVIDLGALSAAKLQIAPYPWASYESTFSQPPPGNAFPTIGFTPHAQRRILEVTGKKGSDPWYQHNVETRPLLGLGEDQVHGSPDLDAYWLQVAEDLLAPAYRECISDVTGYDVRRLQMQVHFWCYKEGSFFQPHVDKPHKIVTHLMYLTDNWSSEMGGCFRILASERADDIYAEIPPTSGRSILLRRTDNAWHSVELIPRGSTQERRVLQAWFWADPSERVQPK
jgi:hypothetical protein